MAKRRGVRGRGSATWLDWGILLWMLFALAAAWRWAYLLRLGATAFANGLDADSSIYWAWSGSILRHGLVPPSPFFLAPLYPYALAAWRSIGSGSIGQVLAIQATLGAAAVVLLADATRRVAGRGAALGVGILLALFQPTTFFDGLILPESLLFFLESVLVWLVATTPWARASGWRFVAYGALVGVLAQGRASYALLLLLVMPLARAGAKHRAAWIGKAAIAAAAFGVCCLPATLANHAASGEWIPFTYNLGFNLYVGNHPEATGAYVDVTGGTTPVPLRGTSGVTGGAIDGRAYLAASRGLTLSPAASSAYWAGEAARFVRAHPWRALELAGRKLLLAWNAREVPQIERMDSFARAAGPLGLPVLGSFGCLALLGLAGTAWAFRGDVALRWSAGALLLLTLGLLPFFVTERYRIHLAPALSVLAGITLAEIASLVRARAIPARARVLATLPIAAAIVLVPIAARPAPSHDLTFAADRAIRLLERGSYEEAAGAFASAERSLGAFRAETLSSSARVDLAAFYFRYGAALEALDRSEEAIARWERAAALAPDDAEILGRLSLACERAGREAEASRLRERLRLVPGGLGQLLLHEGWSSARRGELAGAERSFESAVQAAPDLSLAWEGLIRVRIQTGRYDEAAEALDRARSAGLHPLPAAIYESYLALQRGNLAAARRALAAVPADAAASDPVLTALLAASRSSLAR